MCVCVRVCVCVCVCGGTRQGKGLDVAEGSVVSAFLRQVGTRICHTVVGTSASCPLLADGVSSRCHVQRLVRAKHDSNVPGVALDNAVQMSQPQPLRLQSLSKPPHGMISSLLWAPTPPAVPIAQHTECKKDNCKQEATTYIENGTQVPRCERSALSPAFAMHALQGHELVQARLELRGSVEAFPDRFQSVSEPNFVSVQTHSAGQHTIHHLHHLHMRRQSVAVAHNDNKPKQTSTHNKQRLQRRHTQLY